MKRKVLFYTEYTGAKSGFGKIGRELLSRLVKNPNLEIAEASCFGTIEHNYSHAKWKVYPFAVNNNHPEFQAFQSNPNNQWGFWRFERLCLDFKPDFIMTWADPWNNINVHQSPFRKFFHFCTCYTCDSIPQQVAWFDNFRDSDSMFTYADWCIPYLQKHGCKPIQALYPGIDINKFKPKNKIECRRALGLPENAYIIGTTMRNQQRKLFAELFKAFRIYLDKYGNTEIGKNTYLYLHTSFPDVGWDLPALLNEFGITNRVYFSYICTYSSTPLCFKFSGAVAHSPISNGPTARIPNVGVGYEEEQLCNVFNCMDLYVQYANCEGLGIPSLEAASCGIPVAAIDYSAMSDIVIKTGGIPLKPASIPRDQQMRADRVAPDNYYAADAFFKFLSLDKNYRDKKGKQARTAAETYFDWDKCAATLGEHFEKTKLTGLQGKWESPIQISDHNIPVPPDNLSNLHYIQWLATFVAKRPELATKYFGLELLSGLNNGGMMQGHQMVPFTREQAYEIFKTIGINTIGCERARVGMDPITMADFIEFSNYTVQS